MTYGRSKNQFCECHCKANKNPSLTCLAAAAAESMVEVGQSGGAEANKGRKTRSKISVLQQKFCFLSSSDVDWFFFIFCKFCLHFDDGAIFHSRNFAQQKQTQKSAKEKVSQSQLPNLLLAWPWISKGPQFRDRVQRSSSRGRVLGEVNVHDLNPKSFVAKSLWIPGMRRGQ